MFRVLFLVVIHCLMAETVRSCQNAAVGISRSLHFSGRADLFLQGHGYRNLTRISMARCGMLCLSNTRCFSFNYSDRDKLCELNGASASQFPQALVEKNDTYYYEPEKPRDVKQLCDNGGSPSPTDSTYHTHTLASSECQRNDQHLCQRWELDEAYQADHLGKIPTDTGFWYSVPESQVELNSSGLTYFDLPGPLITVEIYGKADLVGIAAACSALGAHLCTLAELKEAYLRGYRQSYAIWMYFSIPNRDVQLLSDGCGSYIGEECYEGVVPNTPRPDDTGRVICCPVLSVVTSAGICCPGNPGLINPRYPIITTESYALNDRVEMEAACSLLDAHLCTLAELKEVYLMGYRQPPFDTWYYFSLPNRDVQLYIDGCSVYIGDECYEGVVANTPRPNPTCQVFCCPVTSQ